MRTGFVEFVNDCFIKEALPFPAWLLKRAGPADEVRRRLMLSETFLAMACNESFRITEDFEVENAPRVFVEDEGNRELGRILVTKFVLRKIGHSVLESLQEIRDGRVKRAPLVFQDGQEEVGVRILREAFGISLKSASPDWRRHSRRAALELNPSLGVSLNDWRLALTCASGFH